MFGVLISYLPNFNVGQENGMTNATGSWNNGEVPTKEQRRKEGRQGGRKEGAREGRKDGQKRKKEKKEDLKKERALVMYFGPLHVEEKFLLSSIKLHYFEIKGYVIN